MLALSLAACAARQPPPKLTLREAAELGSALAISDALEAAIAAGTDTAADREFAYEAMRADRSDTAASNFARATIIGRLIQQRGLRAGHLIGEVERYARRSRELDDDYRDGAATRMLGTLYVMAPATLLRHGDSETGIELLEEAVDEHPDVPENHLRLAEAYMVLRDPEPAPEHLCAAEARKQRLRADDQALLRALMTEAGIEQCPPQDDTD